MQITKKDLQNLIIEKDLNESAILQLFEKISYSNNELSDVFIDAYKGGYFVLADTILKKIKDYLKKQPYKWTEIKKLILSNSDYQELINEVDSELEFDTRSLDITKNLSWKGFLEESKLNLRLLKKLADKKNLIEFSSRLEFLNNLDFDNSIMIKGFLDNYLKIHKQDFKNENDNILSRIKSEGGEYEKLMEMSKPENDYKITFDGTVDLNNKKEVFLFGYKTDLENLDQIRQKPYFLFANKSNDDYFIGDSYYKDAIVSYTSDLAHFIRFKNFKDYKVVDLKVKDGKFEKIMIKTDIDDKKYFNVGDKVIEKLEEIQDLKQGAGLTQIADLLSENQDLIFRTATDGIVLVQGVGGSGKTNLIFHRIDYLIQEFPNKFHKDKIAIFVQNQYLKSYLQESLRQTNFSFRNYLNINLLDQYLENKINIYTDYELKGSSYYDSKSQIFSKTKINQLLEEFMKHFEKSLLLDYGDNSNVIKENLKQTTLDLYTKIDNTVISLAAKQLSIKQNASDKIIRTRKGQIDLKDYLQISKVAEIQKEIDNLEGIKLVINKGFEQLSELDVSQIVCDHGIFDIVYNKILQIFDFNDLESKISDQILKNKLNDFKESFEDMLPEQILNIFAKYITNENKFVIGKIKDDLGNINGFDLEDLSHEYLYIVGLIFEKLYQKIWGKSIFKEFDYVLADEFQDLTPIQLLFLDQMYGESMALTGDFSQSVIYQDQEILNNIGIKLIEQKTMEDNYRNTLEIINFSNAIMQSQIPGISGTMLAKRVIGRGEKAIIQIRQNKKQLFNNNKKNLDIFLDKSYNICVVYHDKFLAQQYYYYFLSQGYNIAFPELENQDKILENYYYPDIYLFNYRDVKGLEFDSVILLDVDNLINDELTENRKNLLYIGTTRPVHDLILYMRENVLDDYGIDNKLYIEEKI